MIRRVLGQAISHPRDLFRAGLGLIECFPRFKRHAQYQGAGFCFVAGKTRVLNPIGQAVATKSRKPHQIDVLGIMAMAQMTHQAAKRCCGDAIWQVLQRIADLCIRIF